MKKKLCYAVAYAYHNRGLAFSLGKFQIGLFTVSGIDTTQVHRSREIESRNDVEEITEAIKAHTRCQGVTVISWQRLPAEDEDA